MIENTDCGACESSELEDFYAAGGLLYPFRHGYEALGRILAEFPNDAWRKNEAVLGGLVLFLLKQGQAVRAKSYLNAVDLEFQQTDRFTVLELLVALHLGEPVSRHQLRRWRRLERSLPITEPLLLGLYYNAMMAMLVRLGHLFEARIAGQQAISCYREDGHIYLEHFIHIHLADMDVIEGRLHRAHQGLNAAERCLAQSGARYGNEDEVIDIVRLAIAFERGQWTKVRERSTGLRASLMNGDSWSELFTQLARISVLSTYFLEGRRAAFSVMMDFQADYARRHNGEGAGIDVLEAVIWHLEWNPGATERVLVRLRQRPLQSAIGTVLFSELEQTLDGSEPPPPKTPRAEIVAALQTARTVRGSKRRSALLRALRLAHSEGQIAPFLEHRDVFLGLNASLSNKVRTRISGPLLRMTNSVLRLVSESYVVPQPLRALGFNRRQYRVASALLSGATNKQIARQLGTTEATVKYHLTSIYRKTQVSRRAEFIEKMHFLEER